MLKKISSYVFDIVKKNLGWKIFSLVFAIMLWFIVMNINNPAETMTFNVNLTLLNKDKLADKGYVVLNSQELENKKIDIKVKSTRPGLDDLSKNRDLLKATIDLQQFDLLYADDIDEAFTLMVTPTIPSSYVYNYELVSFFPTNAEVKLDKVVEAKRTISVDRTGSVPAGYTVNQTAVKPDKITVKGASSVIDKIDSVRVNADLTGISGDLSLNLAPVCYDKDGKIIEDVYIDTSFINVSFSAYKKGEIPVSAPITVGAVRNGCKVVSVNWEPKYIEVIGNDESLEKFTSITLPGIDLSGESQSKSISFDVSTFLNGTGLKVKSGSPTSIKVNIIIEPEVAREIIIHPEDIKITGASNTYAVTLPDDVIIRITGVESLISKVKKEDIGVSVNVGGTKSGTIDLPVTIELPDGISAVGTATVKVIVSENNSEAETDENENTNAPVEPPEVTEPESNITPAFNDITDNSTESETETETETQTKDVNNDIESAEPSG